MHSQNLNFIFLFFIQRLTFTKNLVSNVTIKYLFYRMSKFRPSNIGQQGKSGQWATVRNFKIYYLEISAFIDFFLFSARHNLL